MPIICFGSATIFTWPPAHVHTSIIPQSGTPREAPRVAPSPLHVGPVSSTIRSHNDVVGGVAFFFYFASNSFSQAMALGRIDHNKMYNHNREKKM